MKPLLFFLLIVVLSSCQKFETDEEIRENISGTWVRCECFPRQRADDSGVNVHPLPWKIILLEDGSYLDGHNSPYCIETGCDTSEYPSFCTCEYAIEDGSLIITDENALSGGYFNEPLPITCLTKKRLEFGNVVVNGVERVTRCYERE